MSNPFDWSTYRAVLASVRWKRLREHLLSVRGERCERCGAVFAPGTGARRLRLHHLTYERLGCELDDDVQLVCLGCHEAADRERARRSRDRAESALYAARLQGWVESQRGEGAEADADDEEAFNEWLEGQEE